MKDELAGIAVGVPVAINHVILDGSVVVLRDGRVLNVPGNDARVTNEWSPSTGLEIWTVDPSSTFPLCVRNTIRDEEVHGRWAPGMTSA